MLFIVYLFVCFYSDFSPILVPLQSAMTVTLPSGAGSHLDHNPFPGSLACIVGFEDTVSNAKTVNRTLCVPWLVKNKHVLSEYKT